jgi:hypothetical protein
MFLAFYSGSVKLDARRMMSGDYIGGYCGHQALTESTRNIDKLKSSFAVMPGLNP